MEYSFGTMGNDALTISQDYGYMVGLAGNDQLAWQGSGVADVFMGGGSGNDSYAIGQQGLFYIVDTQGTDTLQVPWSYSSLMNSNVQHLLVDGWIYALALLDRYGDPLCLIGMPNYFANGKVEGIQFSDGQSASMDSIYNALGGWSGMTRATSAQLEVTAELAEAGNYAAIVTGAENLYRNFSTPAWFNDDAYMQSRAGGTDTSAVKEAFFNAGFIGRDGDYVHFQLYGQYEDASPSSLFNAEYYYRSKAAQFYNRDISQVTEELAGNMRQAIKGAGMNAWTHYQQYGSNEGVDASIQFDTEAYMQAKLNQMQRSNPGYTMDQLEHDFAQAGLGAVAHYEAYGKAEGLQPIGIPQPLASLAADAA
jgi:hypothetical protein